MGKKIPETLTLVDASTRTELKTLTVEGAMDGIVLRMTEPGKGISIFLDEAQMKKLQARLAKHFRDTR